MAAGLLTFPGSQPSFGLDGERVTASLYFYQNETTIPQSVYSDFGLTTPHAFPVVSDSSGMFPLIYADSATMFGAVWATADGQTLRLDDFSASTSASQSILDATEDARDAAIAAQEGAEDLYGDLAAVQTAATGSAASAAAALVSQNAAAASASAAATSQGAAATSETNAATSASLSRSYTGSVTFNFSTTTTDSDPGSGNVRFNNASPASTTFVYFDNNESGGADVSAWLDSFDDSSSTTKGHLYVREGANGAFAVFIVTGAVINGAGYRKVPVAYLSGGGTFQNTQMVGANYSATGDVATSTVFGYAAKTAAYTVVSADRGKIIEVTAGTFTIDATSAATLGAGFFFWLKNIGTGTTTFNPAGAETVDLVASKDYVTGDAALIETDGTNWHTVLIPTRNWRLRATTPISGSPTTITYTSAIIPTDHIDLMFEFDTVVYSVSNCLLSIELSTDGVTWSPTYSITRAGGGAAIAGVVKILNYRREFSIVEPVLTSNALTSPEAEAPDSSLAGVFGGVPARIAGGIAAVRFSLNTGSFATGTVRAYSRL